MTERLVATVRATRRGFHADATSLGARPGTLAALHPWSQTWVFPPPLHGLVTGGGLTDAGLGVAVEHGVLLPVRVVMAGFGGNGWQRCVRGWHHASAGGQRAGAARRGRLSSPSGAA
jgi:Putative transposase